MLRPLAILPVLALAASPALASDLDQESPYSNAWMYCEPGLVWQQQVRVGTTGILDAFEVAFQGPIGSHYSITLRAGDTWNVGPALWSGTYTKLQEAYEPHTYDVGALGLTFSAGDTFVIEATGDGGGAEILGNYIHPEIGPANYPEPLFLNGAEHCWYSCGWRIGFQTWMTAADAGEVVRAGLPANPIALRGGVTSGPVLGATWDPVIDHAAFLPTATLDLLLISKLPGAVNLPGPFGTVLCDFSVAPIVRSAAPGAPFSVSLPADPSLDGLELHTQGMSIDGMGAAQLTNALDVTLASS